MTIANYQQGGGTGWRRHLWIPLAALAAIVLSHSIAAAPTKEIRRILILNEVGTSYPITNLADQGIRTALENSLDRIEFYREYMDTVLFPDTGVQRQFRDFFIRKYQTRQPDVIITVGPAPLKFMVEAHQEFFPGVPVVYCVPNGLPGGLTLDPAFVGVEGDLAPTETVAAALRLLPDTKHVVVVGGIAAFDRQQQAIVKQRLKAYEGRLDISYLTDLAMPALLERLKHLPSHTIVLVTPISQDAAGAGFISSQSGPMIVAAANAPVFSLSDRFLNHGELGGNVSSALEQGKFAGGVALRILNGEKPQDIATAKGLTTYMFDWRALRHWGLKESNLPPGSIVLNRSPSVWEFYKRYLIGGISLVVVETLLIFALLWQRAKRRKAESQLAASFDTVRESEQRFRLVANTAPVKIWMSGPDKLCDYFNRPWLEFTGRTLEEELGNGWAQGVHAEDLEACLDTYTRAFDLRESFRMEYRLRRHDGEYRWMLDRGVPRLNLDGSFAGYIGSCIDITDHKLAEEALAHMGRKLIEAHEEERTWIARELHDDINQRIALLVAQLGQHPSDSKVELTNHIRHVRQELSNLAKDIQAISHRLHSSKLEYLGIASAAQSFCKELSEQQKVEVEFSQEGIPRSLPKEISLCLFRVLQEALQNAVKHSGERHFRVQLHGTSREVQLTVNDIGVGFDAQDVVNRRGLGLVSMRERLQLVGGEFSVKSELGHGTTISARVPLKAQEEHFARAAAG